MPSYEGAIDNRIPLPSGYTLRLQKENGNVETILLETVVGYGGSCIAYRGLFQDITQIPVIVKEYYPKSLNISREQGAENNYNLLPENESSFGKGASRFKEASEKAAGFHTTFRQNNYFSYGSANNTVYAYSLLKDGNCLDQLQNHRKLSFRDILEIMENICEALLPLHDKFRLYLDCKPANLFITPDNKVELFDFDTVIAKEHIKKYRYHGCPYSMGWAAPEQLPHFHPCHHDGEIDNHTDIFSIVSVFFWLLTGKKPYTEEQSYLLDIQKGCFHWREESTYCCHADKIVVDKVESIVKSCLAPDPSSRSIRNIKNLKQEFVRLSEDVSEIQKEHIHRSISIGNRFKYDAENVAFVGRGPEMQFLREMCDDPRPVLWTGICGDGGQGKTRLAFELCKEMQNYEWEVYYPCHFESVKGQLTQHFANLRRDTLICLDYIRWDEDAIFQMMRGFYETHTASICKVRFILLERDKDVFSTEYADLNELCFRNELFQKGILELPPLDTGELNQIMSSFAEYLKAEEDIFTGSFETLYGKLLQIDENKTRPLYALFLTDAWSKGEDIEKWDRRDALNYFTTREKDRIMSSIRSLHPSDIMFEKEYWTRVSRLLAKATYLGGATLHEEDIQDAKLLYILRKLHYWDETEQKILPIEPDLIGEYYCADYLNSLSESEAETFFEELSTTAFGSMVAFSKKLYSDYQDYIEDAHWLTYMQNISLPETFTYIKKQFFENCTFLKHLTLHDRVSLIGAKAFRGCTSLEHFEFPLSLERVRSKAFEGCTSLKSFWCEGKPRIPSIVFIDSEAFRNCRELTEVTIPNSVSEIGTAAFENCESLQRIIIPKKMKIIQARTFANCRNLKHVAIWSNCSFIGRQAFKNCPNLELPNLSENCKIDLTAFQNTMKTDTSPALPTMERLDGATKTKKAKTPSPKEYKLPERERCLRRGHFKNWVNTEAIYLHDGITHIPPDAFRGCTSLKKVVLSGKTEVIGEYAFAECKALEEIELPSSIEQLGQRAFYKCGSLKKVIGLEHARITKISKETFKWCSSLRELKLPISVQEIGAHAFFFCKNLEFISGFLPRDILNIGIAAFQGCDRLEELILPQGITSIAPFTFKECRKLRKIISLSPNLIEICQSAFYHCDNLEEFKPRKSRYQEAIELPDSLQEIGVSAFSHCRKIQKLHIPDSVHAIGAGAFEQCSHLEQIQLPESIKKISVNCFKDCYVLTEIKIPDSVTCIRAGAFRNCYALTDLMLPEGLQNIEASAFRYCDSLKTVQLPSGVSKLEVGAFFDCKELQEIRFNQLRVVGEYAFYHCKKLQSIPIERIKGQILQSAFEQCSSLTEATLSETLCALGGRAFRGCTALERVLIPASHINLLTGVFRGCTSLREIKLLGEQICVKKEAFWDCPNLYFIDQKYPDSITYEEDAFQNCPAGDYL